MRPSHNLSPSPRIYPSFFRQLCATLSESMPIHPIKYPRPFSTTVCDPPRTYPSLPEYIRFSTTTCICDPLRLYAFSQNIYTSISTTICGTYIIYPPPPFPEYTPVFNNYIIMRHSQNLSLPPGIYPPFNNYMRHSQKIPLPPRIHPLFLTTICPTLLSEYIIPHLSTTICDIPRITDAPGLFLETTCNCERIYHSLPKLKNILGERCRSGRVAHINWLKRGVYSGREGYILGGSHNIIVVKKGGIFWEGG